VPGAGPAAAPGIAASTPARGDLGAASPVAGGASYPFPSNLCSGSVAAQISGQILSATGSSRVDTGSASPAYVLSAGVNSNGSSDLSRAAADAQSRIGAIVNAVVGAGVPRGAIHTSYVNVSANGGKGGRPIPLGDQSSPDRQVNVNANASLTAELPNPGIVDKVVTAATGAGADNVSVSTQGSPITSPPADATSAALAQAVAQAKMLAEASARAAGVTLGSVHSLATQQPTSCGYGPNGPQLVVGVTMGYDIK